MDPSESAEDSVDSLIAEAVCGVESSHAGSYPDADLPAAGTIIAERYRVERLLGQGGMGAVFAGSHVVTGKRVALKWLRGDPARHKDAAARMTREARAAGRIHHPNVVDVYDAGFVGERPFFVMELLEGESLEQRIAQGPLSVEVAVHMLLQVIRGVAAVHAHGIVHRDLKPANIFVCRDAEGRGEFLKVLDFGISKLRPEADDDLTVTEHGVQIGTPMFMAPEQVRGDPLDERADVYALSVTLHYMLTQRYPFQARTRSELFVKILTQSPTPLSAHRPHLPAGLSALVLKGLEQDRTRRFASVNALAEALAPYAAGARRRRFGWAGRALARPLSRAPRGLLAVVLMLLASALTVWATQAEPQRSGPAPGRNETARASSVMARSREGTSALNEPAAMTAVADPSLAPPEDARVPSAREPPPSAPEPSPRVSPARRTRPREAPVGSTDKFMSW